MNRRTAQSTVTFFNTLSSNNFALISYFGDTANTGHQDTGGTSNSIACIDAAVAYYRQRYAFSNIFVMAESAGGSTALNYVASHHEKVAGLVLLSCPV